MHRLSRRSARSSAGLGNTVTGQCDSFRNSSRITARPRRLGVAGVAIGRRAAPCSVERLIQFDNATIGQREVPARRY